MKKAPEFWQFVRERESIRLRRAAGLPPPWTKDKILQAYKFTNVKREHDRTSIGLKAIYERHAPQAPDHVVWLNCALYRYFGTVEMATALGWCPAWDAAAKRRMIKLAEARLADDERVFTGAYIVPNCGDKRAKHFVVGTIMDGVWRMVSNTEFDYGTWEGAVGALVQLWGVGSFMAKEIALDYVMATGWKPADWQTWTPIGPGARRGAYRVLHGKLDKEHGLAEPAALEVCRELYGQHMDQWETHWSTHGSPGGHYVPELDLTDIQFQLCEYDKWCRVREGSGKPRSRFVPHQGEIK